MHDDEAFLRAVLAAPNDVAPKLIYADWLDEHDDPRGPYLRLLTARLHDPHAFRDPQPFLNQLRRLGQRVEPLWKAQITPPPVGVHDVHVRWHDVGPPLTLARLEHYEAQLHITLPVEYRAFLLAHNGGSPWPNVCRLDYWYYERVVDFHAVGVPYTDPDGHTINDGLARFAARFRSVRDGRACVPIATTVRYRDRAEEDNWDADEYGSYGWFEGTTSGLALNLETRQIVRYDMVRNYVHTELFSPSLGALLHSLRDVPHDWEPPSDDDD